MIRAGIPKRHRNLVAARGGVGAHPGMPSRISGSCIYDDEARPGATLPTAFPIPNPGYSASVSPSTSDNPPVYSEGVREFGKYECTMCGSLDWRTVHFLFRADV